MREVYRFEEFELDAQTYALRRDGQALSVEPMVLDLILDLLRHHGQLRTRDDLVASVWDGRFVSDSTVSTAVKMARKVLGDSGNEQRFIKTVRGRGFLFDAALEHSAPPEPRASSDGVGPALAVLVTCFDETWSPLQVRAFSSRLRSVLGRIPLLRVAATAPKDPEDFEAMCAAGLSHVVEIGVQQIGGKIAMGTALVDTRSGLQVWAQQFANDATPGASEILLFRLVAQLEPAITRAMIDALSGADTNPRARVLEAVSVLATRGWNRDSFTKANALLDEALRADPGIAIGHAYAALIRALSHRVGINRDEAVIPQAIYHAEAALELETQDSFVLGVAGCALCDAGQLARGAPILRRAAELNPSNGHALTALGASLMMEGRYEEAIENLRSGIEISPADSRLAVWEALLALAQLINKQVDKAEEAARTATSRDDKNYLSRLALAATMVVKDDPKGLSSACRELLRVHPGLTEDEVKFFIGKRLCPAVWGAVSQWKDAT